MSKQHAPKPDPATPHKPPKKPQVKLDLRSKDHHVPTELRPRRFGYIKR